MNSVIFQLKRLKNLVDILSKAIRHRHGLHEQSVVLVRGLGETHLVRLLRDGLAVGHDRVGLLDGDLSVVLLKILEADFQVELASAGDDVFARLLDDALHHRVRLGKTLKT